ncbi:MAG TPA: hypothetical protein VNL96_03310 [Gemmatimonadaceae bacterium]|nr:hypothetical protein [Gemmatimonadaceae bacterium]
MRILLAIVMANLVVSLVDWYFFGVLWHEKYKAYPEVWRRPQGGPGEGRAVALSALVGALTPTVFVLLCVALGMVRLQQALQLGVGVWLVAPVPMWSWNYIFMKVHPLVVVSGIVGWLVRLGVTALVVGLLLG